MRKNIKSLIASKITAHAVAAETGLPRNTVYRIFTGETELSNVKFGTIEILNQYYLREMNKMNTGRSEKTLKDINFDGMNLTHSSFGAGDLGENIYKQNYINEVENNERTPNKYEVSWDLTDFFEAEKTSEGYNWDTPTIIYKLTETKYEYDTDDFFKVIEIYGEKAKVLSRPKLTAPMAGQLIYSAHIVTEDNDVYAAYWNLFNIFDPCKIELIVDNSRQCKHCLKPWKLKEIKCVHANGHEYISHK